MTSITEPSWNPDVLPVKMVHLLSGVLVIGKIYQKDNTVVVGRPLLFSVVSDNQGRQSATFHDVRPYGIDSNLPVVIQADGILAMPYEPVAEVVEMYYAAWNSKTRGGSWQIAGEPKAQNDSPFVKR